MAVSQPSFEDALNVPMHEVTRPKPLPQGTYTFNVLSWREDKSSKKQTAFVEYTLQPIAFEEDVDESEVDDMGGLANRTIRHTFYLTPDAMWRLRKFLEDCGVDVGNKRNPKMAGDLIPQAVGAQVLGHVKHEPSRAIGSTDVYAVISSTAKAA